MTLIRFNQIRSVYHPESGEDEMENVNKCYQLHYDIIRFNDQAGNVIDMGSNAVFDEDMVHMRSIYCPIRQYNKEKPGKFHMEFLY